VAAVTIGGTVIVSSGSIIATFAAIAGLFIVNLNFSLVSVITEENVTSLPVPAVVGIVMRGMQSPFIFHLP